MTTGNTTLLGLALPVQGELSGTWGDVVNNSITSLVDTAIAGTTTLSTDANVTLTTTTLAANQARQAILLCTGARTATRTITAPAQSKIYTIINATTGGYGVNIVGVGPTTGLYIPPNAIATVAWNGSDFVPVTNQYINYAAGVKTTSGSFTASIGNDNVMAGQNAGFVNATSANASIGDGNVILGTGAGALDTMAGAATIANYNTFIGYNAGSRNGVSFGNYNVGIGNSAGSSLPTNIVGTAVIGAGNNTEESAATDGAVIITNGLGTPLFSAVYNGSSTFSSLTVSSNYTKLAGGFGAKAPPTINAATYTVLADAYTLIFATTNCVVTLPSASANSGRVLILKSRTSVTITSASSNVVPLASATAGTAILSGTGGKFAYLQSDGTNWITMMSN